MVSTHLKNIGQIGSFPQVGAKIQNIWNRQLDSLSSPFLGVPQPKKVQKMDRHPKIFHTDFLLDMDHPTVSGLPTEPSSFICFIATSSPVRMDLALKTFRVDGRFFFWKKKRQTWWILSLGGGWVSTHLKNISQVKLDHFPQGSGWKKNYSKPPPR